MSSNSNHINPIITLDNYEEYFILYMDNELDQNQVQMVKGFLQQHPHLQIELDMLMETKLPVEEISFDKSSLLSVNMSSPIAEEDILLLIDNELQESRKKIVQLELASNPEYQQQFQQLLHTKLDPSEVVVHPNKKELYRRETRVIGMAVWMRIAAALIVIAALSVLYFVSTTKETLPANAVAVQPSNNQSKENKPSDNVKESDSPVELAVNKPDEKLPAEKTGSEKLLPAGSSLAKTREKENKVGEDQLAVNRAGEDAIADSYEGNTNAMNRTASIETSKQSFNNKIVTVDHVDPYNNITASIPPGGIVGDPVSNNDHKKGSLKTFFRKATRIVGQTTGFNASNGDDELLIGAVAVKL